MDEPQEKPRPPRPEEPAPRDDVVVGQNRCPFCRDDVRGPTTDWVACAACLARHHEPCWGEGGGRCAACGHGERLRADGATRSGRRWGVILVAILLIFGSMVVAYVGTTRATRGQAFARVEAERATRLAEIERLKHAERELLDREQHRIDAAEGGRVRQDVTDKRFEIARRVDELRRLNRSGSRVDARRGRRQAAWKQARMDLALALLDSESGSEDASRFRAAREGVERLDPPRSRDGPLESILEEQDEYLMPPRAEDPEFDAFMKKMLDAAQRPGYAARLLVLANDPDAALIEANRGLDQDATDWLAWLARGEALLVMGEQRGAAMAFTLSEAFSAMNSTWALLGRVDLARARGDHEAELAAAYDALEVGQVPEWGGHLQALLERIATLEHELGERR